MIKYSVLFVYVSLIIISCSGGVGTSDPDVNDNINPTCSITSPLNGTNFYKNSEIIILVEASDPDGIVSVVKLYIDGIGIGSDNTEPYSFTIPATTITSGSHVITATAVDSLSAETSSNINIIVLDLEGGIITVTSPQAGNSWLVGTKHDITWTDNISENVKIELFKNFKFLKTIISSTESDGVYNWIVTDTLKTGNDYIVKVSSTTDPLVWANSYALFTIVAGVIPGEMIFVQGGTFDMGENIFEYFSYDIPIHSVTVSDFYICATEVTKKEYRDITGSGSSVDIYYPANYINSYDAIKYCNLRSISENLTPCYNYNGSTDPVDWGSVSSSWNTITCNWNTNGYRLPSEAEWEYAARGGIHWRDNYYYSGSNNLDEVGWNRSNAESIIHPVGTKIPNQLGIYDMTGNALEWVWDWVDYEYYEYCVNIGTVVNPHGPPVSNTRVMRGGSWLYADYDLLNGHRFVHYYPYTPSNESGLRVVRSKL